MDQRRVSLTPPKCLGPSLTHASKRPDLPSDILSTPFGAALRPTIDSMFGRPTTAPHQPPTNAYPRTTTSPPSTLLQSISDRATGMGVGAPDSGYSSPSPSTSARARATGPGPQEGGAALHAPTDPASFRALLGSHRALVAMFTSATCPPCRMIEPVFSELAREKGGGGSRSRGPGQGQIAFAKVDLGVGLASMVAREYNVSATPTFGFFLDGKKVSLCGSVRTCLFFFLRFFFLRFSHLSLLSTHR